MTTGKARRTTELDLDATARWAFILGLALAVLLALLSDFPDWALWVMILLGLFAGYVFIDQESEHHFFLVAIGLLIFSQVMATLPSIGDTITAILINVATFFGAMVLALVVRNIVSWVSTPR